MQFENLNQIKDYVKNRKYGLYFEIRYGGCERWYYAKKYDPGYKQYSLLKEGFSHLSHANREILSDFRIYHNLTISELNRDENYQGTTIKRMLDVLLSYNFTNRKNTTVIVCVDVAHHAFLMIGNPVNGSQNSDAKEKEDVLMYGAFDMQWIEEYIDNYCKTKLIDRSDCTIQRVFLDEDNNVIPDW